MKERNHLFDEIDSEVESLVDAIFKNTDPKQTGNLSNSLKDILSGKTLRERLENGFAIIFRELTTHEAPIVLSEVQKNWTACMKKMEKVSKTTLLEEDAMKSFGELFGISEETIQHFYNCGFRLYENKLYEEASDVFFVTSFIDYKRHNTWMALALSDKHLKKWETALSAFSMAILTNKENPLPFLHSSECYLALGKNHDAKECIDEALKLLQSKSDENTKELINFALTLKKSA